MREALPATSDNVGYRVAWVDYAKGWSIVLVVTMHSALGVGLAVGEQGWLHETVAFAKLFRMPDFFLVAGLFAGRAIDRPWRNFLDRKVVHFAYFYALWLCIALVAKFDALDLCTPGAWVKAYLFGFVQPFSSMWFIQLLPILFVAARLAKRFPLPLVLCAAVLAHIAAAAFPEGGQYAMASQMTGWVTLDSFLLFFVYFYCGYRFSGPMLAFARWLRSRPAIAVAGLVTWAVIEEHAVKLGVTEMPGLTLAFGLAGGLAVIAASVLLDRAQVMSWLAHCGRNPLAIYLSFFVPMAATRMLILKTGLVSNVGAMSLIVASAAIALPLAVSALARGTILEFLYVRPSWARTEWTACSGALAHAA
jgi:uncharacterized membrane protein YcfT